jgi:hypothetical protein
MGALDTRARGVGRKVGERRWLVALRNLVPRAPTLLHDVEIESDGVSARGVTMPTALASEVRPEWWRELEREVQEFLPGGDAEECALLARVVSRLPWHSRKVRVLRPLEERASGAPPRSSPVPAAPRWIEMRSRPRPSR